MNVNFAGIKYFNKNFHNDNGGNTKSIEQCARARPGKRPSDIEYDTGSKNRWGCCKLYDCIDYACLSNERFDEKRF
jgi:hypothetical protein